MHRDLLENPSSPGAASKSAKGGCIKIRPESHGAASRQGQTAWNNDAMDLFNALGGLARR